VVRTRVQDDFVLRTLQPAVETEPGFLNDGRNSKKKIGGRLTKKKIETRDT
jgi:hypothetical protein